jgi:hypothetical protein
MQFMMTETHTAYLADNLAWKMSDVLKGIAANPEQLLDSYTFEVRDILFY